MIDIVNGKPALPQARARELTEKELALVTGGFGWKSFFHDVAKDTALGGRVGTFLGEPVIGYGLGVGVGIAHGVSDGLGR